MIELTAVPPCVLNVIVYWLICHWAVIVIPVAGILAGISLSQPVNVYPVLVGSAGGVMAVS